jgi:hypothetical protein
MKERVDGDVRLGYYHCCSDNEPCHSVDLSCHNAVCEKDTEKS